MDTKKNGKIMGRPVKELDWKEFEQLCFLQCSLQEVCLWFHISHQTLEKRCKEYYGETFRQIFEKKRVGGLISLRRNLFKQSEHNPACAIFLAKNLLGMTDHQLIEHTAGDKPLKITVVSETAKELTQKLIQD